MRIFVIDFDGDVLESLRGRVKEALRQTGLKRVDIVSGEYEVLAGVKDDDTNVVILGPSCYQMVADAVSRVRSQMPDVPIAIVLNNDTYATEAVELRREINARIMPIGDIVQIVQFLLESDSRESSLASTRRGVISVVHFKGGVGASTVAAGLASVWARHDISVVLVDLDDVNPQLTSWGRVSNSKRELVADMIRDGRVPKTRINELVHPVEGFDGRLVIVGQPEQYQCGFHLKADVLEGAPSSAEYIGSLVEALREEFDVVVVDMARSWGVATFSLLPLSQQVLLVLDDDGMSVRSTLDCLKRFYQESSDGSEFDLSRWRVVLNGYTGRLLSPSDVSAEIDEIDLFPATSELFTIPFSESGRQWGAPGVSFYDCADEGTKLIMREVAFSLIPFRQAQSTSPFASRLAKGLRKLIIG